MLPLAILTMVATSPGQTFVVSVFNPFWRDSLQLSHSQLTGAYMLGTLLASLPQPAIGRLMDRWGIRRMMAIVVSLFGLACFLTSQVQNLFTLFLAFICLRMLGQGALSLLASNIMAMWFRQRLGFVAGLMNVGVSAITGLLPSGILLLIQQQGWRWTYALLGSIVWLLMLPLIFILFRNKPEDIGQQLDGLKLNSRMKEAYAASEPLSFTLSAARQTPAYWIILLASALWGMVATAVFFNIIPVFTTQGLSETAATTTYATLALTTVVVQLAAGFLADRLPLNWLVAIGLVFISMAMVALIRLQSVWMGHLYAVFMGSGQALFGISTSILWVRYYGRAHLGRIRGNVWTATVAGSSVGPFLMGFIFDQTGSYQLSLYLFIGLLLPLATAALWARKPDQLLR